MTRWRGWLFLLLAGCGEVVPLDADDESAPDAGGAATLVATTPVDGAIGVSVLTAIELVFDGPSACARSARTGRCSPTPATSTTRTPAC
jgi:hypothetical protein